MKVISSPQSGRLGPVVYVNSRVQRYGVAPVGTVIHIRTRQYLDGWSDVPKQASARMPAPA